jgi:RraA family protein
MSSNKPRSADVTPGPGFRIRTGYDRLDDSIMKRFQNFEVADISDELNRLYAFDPEIRCLTGNGPEQRLCGAACTVRVYPGDNLMVHKALDTTKPGDVIVVDGHGTYGKSAVAGDLVAAKAKHRGIAGMIIDGLVRDLPGVIEVGFPVYARGSTAIGPLHRGPGELNFPIACGGVVVNPGDVIVADSSGIVAIPKENALAILASLEAARERQEKYTKAVKQGKFSNAWVDATLHDGGCQIFESDNLRLKSKKAKFEVS